MFPADDFPLPAEFATVFSKDVRAGRDALAWWVGGENIDVGPQLRDDLCVVRPVGVEREFPPPTLERRLSRYALDAAARGL